MTITNNIEKAVWAWIADPQDLEKKAQIWENARITTNYHDPVGITTVYSYMIPSGQTVRTHGECVFHWKKWAEENKVGSKLQKIGSGFEPLTYRPKFKD